MLSRSSAIPASVTCQPVFSTEVKSTADKYLRLQQRLGQFNRVAVAFSGGVDSSFLLQVALNQLGRHQVLALTAASVFLPASEMQSCQQLTQRIGASWQQIEIDLLALAEVKANTPQRCYYCKKELFQQLQNAALNAGYSVLLDGSNLDDLDDYRPGRQALGELQIISPLLEAGLRKQEIRQLSQTLGLPTWDKPAFACLASRIPYGIALEQHQLQQVALCEDWLRQQGFSNYRVRYHQQLARIELAEPELSRLFDTQLRQQLVATCKKAGFTYVTLDLEGYRTGSLNEILIKD